MQKEIITNKLKPKIMIEKKFVDVTKKELAKKETITWHKGDCQITTLYSIAASWDYLYIVKGYLNQNIMEIAAICGTEAEMVETLLNFNIQKFSCIIAKAKTNHSLIKR